MRTASDLRALENRLGTGVWGLLFLWAGFALLVNVGWGAGLVGAGAIMMAGQLARKALGLAAERSALIIGSVLALIGVWSLFRIEFNLVPLLCIAVGLALLASAVGGRSRRLSRGVLGTPAHPSA